jgi:predicted nuclease of restriction endonuclease-like (RecB) superfamily
MKNAALTLLNWLLEFASGFKMDGFVCKRFRTGPKLLLSLLTMAYFDDLLEFITDVHFQLQAEANRAVNQALTIRNWVIGMHIVEFEQNGLDRARYGGYLLRDIADRIQIKGLTTPELSRCRQFYNVYPHILDEVAHKFPALVPDSILGSVTQEFNTPILGSVTQEFQSTDNQDNNLFIPPQKLLSKLSYTHFVELIKIEEDLKRTFYEMECIKGTWSVRELKRQINSQYFERSGFSINPETFSQKIQSQVRPENAEDIIKNVYVFDFLEINGMESIEESDLETALLDNLQAFIIELGNGFCLEARQKKILIGANYYFIDLVFYHRILKCHVLIELKLGAFSHGDIGQLNTYLNYFKEEIMEESDQPPVGILMVAQKDHALVRYATAGMDQNVFVQQYLIQLPDKDKLEKFIREELEKLK